MNKKMNKTSSRVDLQVIMIVAIYTFISLLFTSQIYWKYTFEVLMKSQEERVTALYAAIESKLNPDTFLHINSPEDMETELYKEAMNTLLDMKQSSGVLYLYTAKPNEEGHFVYIVDGLEPHLDFRFPGDLIEEEIEFKMETALSGVEAMPEKILHTEWGEIFIAYMPFHDEDGTVLGVVGIEFDASESYQTYLELKKSTIISGVTLILTGVLFCVWQFKRISNPLYLDKNTQDTPTGMKNRNAYEVDLNNLIARGKSKDIGVVVADINGLKQVNDRLGHSAGDKYISLVADCIKETKNDTMIGYRTGGDEFVIFVQDATEETLKKFVEICASRVKSQKYFTDMRCSLACGYCMFDPALDKTLEDTFNRADELMYVEKRRQKESEER